MKWIYTTFANPEDATRICSRLIEEKLIACANMLPQMKSIYKWNDQIQTEDEIAVLLKTSDTAIQKASAKLQELHPYECPCIGVIDVASAHPLFD